MRLTLGQNMKTVVKIALAIVAILLLITLMNCTERYRRNHPRAVPVAVVAPRPVPVPDAPTVAVVEEPAPAAAPAPTPGPGEPGSDDWQPKGAYVTDIARAGDCQVYRVHPKKSDTTLYITESLNRKATCNVIQAR
jgi:hypothetical protein